MFDAIGAATILKIREKMIVGIAAPFVEGMPCPDAENQNRKLRSAATAVAMLAAKHSSKKDCRHAKGIASHFSGISGF